MRWLIPCLFLSTALTGAFAAADNYEDVKENEIKGITYDDAEYDNTVECPWAKDLEHLEGDRRSRYDDFIKKLDDWKPAKEENPGKRVKNMVCLLAIVDIAQGEFEGELPVRIFEMLKNDIEKEKLIKAAAWVVLHPKEGETLNTAPDLELDVDLDKDMVQFRAQIYAKKILGRLLEKLPIKDQ